MRTLLRSQPRWHGQHQLPHGSLQNPRRVPRPLPASSTSLRSFQDKACSPSAAAIDAPLDHAAQSAGDDQPCTSGRSSGDLRAALRPGCFDQAGRMMLKNLTLTELEAWCESQGESRRRALQLWRWMYYDDCWVTSLEETIGQQNGFSRAFCDKAQQVASIHGGLELQQVAKAQDGTTKLVFKLTEGEGKGGLVETVLIPAQHRSGGKARLTLCVSSQVGCAMNCQFCYTGRMGLMANLSTAQIVEQMVEALRVLLLRAEGGTALGSITNVVFMGMGEPLHNLESVLAAVDIMGHPLGLHMSHNKVTVSTVGLVDKLEVFHSRCRAQLAVSLHATTDEVRDWIVPVNRRHKLAALMAALRRHYPQQGAGTTATAAAAAAAAAAAPAGTGAVERAAAPAEGTLVAAAAAAAAAGSTTSSTSSEGQQRSNRSVRRVLIEYTMLQGINDTLEDAERLLQLLEGIEAKVNLIQFNPYSGTRFQPSSMEQVLAFRSVLVAGGRVCTIRDSRGDDEMAACGQLGHPQASTRAGVMLEPPERFRQALASC